MTTDIELLKTFAQQAGKIALQKQSGNLDVQIKPGDQSPVSNVDLEIDALGQSILRHARPAYGWLSEESEDTAERLQTDRVFILDPIDGTNAYVQGHTDFTIAIAIVEAHIPTAAVVYAPAYDAMYWATAGQGAWCNKTRLSVSNAQDIHGTRILGRKKHVMRQIGEEQYTKVKWGFRSSLAYRYCLVAEGKWDALLSGHATYEWDAAPGDLILREAGGISTDLKGAPLRFNQADIRQTPGVLGSTSPALQRAILST